MPGEIRVEVDVADQPVEPGSVFTPASARSEGTPRHLVTLTRSGTGTAEAVQLEVASAALQVIVTQFLLGQRAFVDVMNRTYEHNLPNMLTCVRPYDELVPSQRCVL